MQFPVRFKKEFIKELEIIKEKMDKSPNQFTKIYFFSGVHGFINRVLNFDYNKELLLIERILQYCHYRLSEELKKFALQARMQLQPTPDLIREDNLPGLQELKHPISEYVEPDRVPIIFLNPRFFEILSEYIDQLKITVEKDGDLLIPIQNIVELTYSLSGNGHYLLSKNVIKLDLEP